MSQKKNSNSKGGQKCNPANVELSQDFVNTSTSIEGSNHPIKLYRSSSLPQGNHESISTPNLTTSPTQLQNYNYSIKIAPCPPLRNPAKNGENDTENSTINLERYLWMVLFILLAIIFAFVSRNNSQSESITLVPPTTTTTPSPQPPIPLIDSCDLKTNPTYRNFDKYFGIENNPFRTTSAEQKQADEPFYEAILSEKLKSDSFVLVASSGSGKTHIRNHRISKLDPLNSLVVNINGNSPHLNEYFYSFIQNMKKYAERNAKETQLFAQYFNSKDFIHIMIAELVSSITNENFPKTTILSEASRIDRLKIASILGFYSNNERLSRRLIGDLISDQSNKGEKSPISSEKLIKRITEIRDLYASVRIFNNERVETNTKILNDELGDLLALDFLAEPPAKLLSILSSFLDRYANKKLTFVLDSIDENRFFFGKEGLKSVEVMQKFVDSILTADVLSLASGSEAYFDILVFLPEMNEIKFDNKLKGDKLVPVVFLKWDPRMLSNYADFIVFEMVTRNREIQKCKSLPTSFKELLGGGSVSSSMDDLIAQGKIKNPRDLHRFMNRLIEAMNKNLMQRDAPFVPVEQDFKEALQEFY